MSNGHPQLSPKRPLHRHRNSYGVKIFYNNSPQKIGQLLNLKNNDRLKGHCRSKALKCLLNFRHIRKSRKWSLSEAFILSEIEKNISIICLAFVSPKNNVFTYSGKIGLYNLQYSSHRHRFSKLHGYIF